MKNVLIACEESQVECRAWLLAKTNAFSCDIQPCSGGMPERHVQGDALRLIAPPVTFRTCDGKKHHVKKWDLIIAHPPCTYLTAAAGAFTYKGGVLDSDRYQKGVEAREFFMRFWEADCEHIAIENPRPFRVWGLPKPTTQLHPYEFGAPWSKRTYLWLKGLPPLMPTIYAPRFKSWVYSTRGSFKRSKSFTEVAMAMAAQWKEFL